MVPLDSAVGADAAQVRIRLDINHLPGRTAEAAANHPHGLRMTLVLPAQTSAPPGTGA